MRDSTENRNRRIAKQTCKIYDVLEHLGNVKLDGEGLLALDSIL